MASSSSHSHLSSHVILILVIMSLFILSTCSTRGTVKSLNNQMSVKDGFRISIRHIDSNGNYSKLELLQRGVERGRLRLARLSFLSHTNSDDDSSVQSPLYAGNGEFLMNIAIGTPPRSYSAVMDTGSDLIWTQCMPCVECYRQPTPIFDPTQSSSFSKLSCSSNLCKALAYSNCNDGCGYLYAYQDHSTTQGVMGSETFTFDQVSVPNVGFGCGNDNEGRGFTQGGQGAGIVGLGRGPLSLVSQLGMGKFSYCLTSIDDSKSSSILFGSLASSVNTNAKPVTTPLIRNPFQPTFYYLSLEGITVGDTRLPIEKSTFALKEDGSGGVVIDSGTTITYLEATAFELVKTAFQEQIKLPVANAEDSHGLGLCFYLPSFGTSNIKVPKLLFHFTDADLDLPIDNYMTVDSNSGLMCLTMGGSRSMSIIGNVQQQNTLVMHDLNKRTISFTSTKCDHL